MKTTECSEMNKQLLANLQKIEQLTTKVFLLLLFILMYMIQI